MQTNTPTEAKAPCPVAVMDMPAMERMAEPRFNGECSTLAANRRTLAYCLRQYRSWKAWEARAGADSEASDECLSAASSVANEIRAAEALARKRWEPVTSRTVTVRRRRRAAA